MTVLSETRIIADPPRRPRATATPDNPPDLTEIIAQHDGCALYGYIYQNKFHLTRIGKPADYQARPPSERLEFTLAPGRCSSCGHIIEHPQFCPDCLIYF